MARISRGIAIEKAAVRAEQRDVAVQQKQHECRKRPSLGRSMESSKSPNGSYEPNLFLPQLEANLHRTCRQEADAKPLKIERCLDMDLVKKGSFFYMSKNYVEEVDDWYQFIEEHQKSTF
ncbi:hypothetical protein F4813DRAFT_103926 [Daldinia decipiens]|uniref:uncharacterized protein n=1 Tax=Daldinia decipiens TaxID=326647 RepID=UPI0020C35294|nr:uncharacterized protein F4813DRAFT_103926 [Daldinia decipiens]KAI1662281.1 hypothetical protein F4813DRAFT_103926 [Daldinia decipiens]